MLGEFRNKPANTHDDFDHDTTHSHTLSGIKCVRMKNTHLSIHKSQTKQKQVKPTNIH